MYHPIGKIAIANARNCKFKKQRKWNSKDLPYQFPQKAQPKKEWWRVKGGRAARIPPAVFGSAYFSFWLEG